MPLSFGLYRIRLFIDNAILHNLNKSIMKVQVVERECMAKVGVSIEFSNSEIDSLIRIALKLDDKIEEQCKEAHAFIKSSETGVKYKESDELFVRVDLKTLTCAIQAICSTRLMVIILPHLSQLTTGRGSNPLPFYSSIRLKSNKTSHNQCNIAQNLIP